MDAEARYQWHLWLFTVVMVVVLGVVVPVAAVVVALVA